MGSGKSDCAIVPLKRVMIAEGRVQQKGAVQVRKSEPHAGAGNLNGRSDKAGNDPASRRARIAAKARSQPSERFDCLLHHLTPELVSECLAKIPLSSAPGVDGVTVADAQKNLDWILRPLMQQIHEGRYEAPPVRRVYIPKADGGQRPLGVPAVVDRALQAATAKILNEIYEQDFLKCSFGFRPGLGCHHALATIERLLDRHQLNFALEVDIRDFFGSLDHAWLRKFMGLRIGDKRVHKLIDAWLGAGVMEEGKWEPGEVGTPQGGSISPLLANVYLHYVLDLWFEKKIKKTLRGPAELVRYADDFVILFREAEDLEAVKSVLTTRLAQFGLTIAEQKTHTTDLTLREKQGTERRRLTFLGFSIYRGKTVDGKSSKIVFRTENKRFTRAKAKIKAKMHKLMHSPIPVQATAINSFLCGHYNYYGIAGNTEKLQGIWYFTYRHWRECLSRRSQKGSLTWVAMTALLNKHPLRPPRLKIPYTKLSSYVRL
jgi:RNA-directed DNA polymerase